MAGQADKKRAKEAAEYSSRFWISIFIAAGVYILLRVVVCVGFPSRLPSFFECMCLCLSFGVLCFSHAWQKDRLLLGLSSSTATDLYLVSLSSLFFGSLHPWGWGRRLLDWVFTPDATADDTPEALAFKKKQQKLERKAKSGRYTVIQK
ncbi:hypothetical protein Efla_000008 [Eimeria flavescens]